jgi:hypothetical protein
LEEDKDMLSDA